jgi:hypothetical protein
MRSLGFFACPDEHPWQTPGGVPGSIGSRDGWKATDDTRLRHAWPVMFWRQADDDEQQQMCNLVTWRSWWRQPGPAASGRDATSLALGGRREDPPATGCGRRQAASVRFGVVDPMVASGCTGGVLVWHKEEATLARLDRRACKAVVISRRGNRR